MNFHRKMFSFSVFGLLENFYSPSTQFLQPKMQTRAHLVVIYSIIHPSINIKVFFISGEGEAFCMT